MLSQMITDLNANGQDMQIDELKIALGASMLPTLAFSGDAAVASGAAITIPGGKVIIAVAFIAMLYYVYSYDSGAVLTLDQVLDGIYYDQEDTNTETKDNSLDGYVLLEKEMEKVKENKNDDDPNNDYYDAKFSKELEVVIDLENPYGKDVAVQKIIREISRGNPNWYTTNIYTLDINDAIEIIKDAGCVPGPHKDKGAQGLEEIPENHAFTQSYNLFNSNVSLDDYLRGIDGQYCWHFHPLDPITLQIKSKMHILFGVVVKIENGFMSVCILPRDEFLTYCINNITKKEKKLTKVRRL